jgi:hypothetical protein
MHTRTQRLGVAQQDQRSAPAHRPTRRCSRQQAFDFELGPRGLGMTRLAANLVQRMRHAVQKIWSRTGSNEINVWRMPVSRSVHRLILDAAR